MFDGDNTGTFEKHSCIKCSVIWGLPLGYTAQRRKDKATFYCPNGHHMAYVESEADQLRRERDRLKQEMARVEEEKRAAQRGEQLQREWREKAERSAVAYRGVATRLKKKAASGTCPCCNQSFEELHAHMKDAHPEFKGRVRAPDLKLVSNGD